VLHLATVADDRAHYYLDDLGDELRRLAPDHVADGGRWIGRGAAGLGLSGRVDGPALQALLAGGNPRTGRPLVSTRRRTVAGIDLTFTAPKSVSLVFALGERASAGQVMAAHREAVLAAVGHLERRAWAVRRGSGEGRTPVAADGMVAAAFTHCLSRAGDPHLHSHVLAANLAHGADGRWSALDGRGPFAHARAAGALYDAHLRAELTDRLGLSWSWHEGRGWDMDGTDPLVLAAFSGRSAEIRQALAARGSSSARARHVAWAATRDRKDRTQTASDLAASWSERASIAPRWRFERSGRPGAGSDRVDEYRFAAVIAACPPSGVCRRDVVAAWSDALGCGARAPDVERAVDHWAPGAGGTVGISEPRLAPSTCVPAPHLLRALGSRPAAAAGQPVWQRAAAAIEDYRARWGVGDAAHPLGTDGEHLARLPHHRLADYLEVSRAVRDALVRLGGESRAGLERGRPAVERG
jgi:conjugative relaxase-like TrwC/TraI family protein